jgi:DNA-directed RNA polymerase II subunit RPB1
MESKRTLTHSEIEDMVSFVTPNKAIPADISEKITSQIKEKLRAQLTSIEIYPSLIPSLRTQLQKQYVSTQVQAGESVGIITAQSIGERQTQQTLNTFHSSGLVVKTVITGVPRFSELLNATKKPKAVSCNVFFHEKNASIGELREHVGRHLKEITVGSLIQTTKTFSTPQKEEWYAIYTLIHGDAYKKYGWGLRLVLKKDMLFEYSIELRELKELIETAYSDVVCVYSPNNCATVDIYFDTTHITNEEEMYEDDDEARIVYLEEIVLPLLSKLKVFGVDGVSEIFYTKREKEWMVETENGSLKKLLGVSIIDKKRTTSNNMWDIYECFGIEATRQFLIDEFKQVVSSDGTFVNECHMSLLVDVMTQSGTIISISRYGMKKEGSGPMAKASFEESLDNFLKAGVYGEKETTNGVSASIMLGKLAKFGTGICDVRVDVDAILRE